MSEQQIQFVCCDLCSAKAEIGTPEAALFETFAAQGDRPRFHLCEPCDSVVYREGIVATIGKVWQQTRHESDGAHNKLVVAAIQSMCITALHTVVGGATTE